MHVSMLAYCITYMYTRVCRHEYTCMHLCVRAYICTMYVYLYTCPYVCLFVGVYVCRCVVYCGLTASSV